ncbi:MAG: hypothetical protein M3Q69_19370, partial [Acidobacteriota bacterium]|nr:hypothetical protein [Acidobacteriota bacterium]
IPSGPYLDEFGAFTASSKVLIIDTLMPDGSIQTVVWDFREAGVVKRRAYLKTLLKQLWTARGVPTDFSHTVAIDAVEFDDRPYGVRILALDDRGRIAIDQILQPRAY